MYSITIHDLTLPIKDPDEAIQITPVDEKRSLVRYIQAFGIAKELMSH